MRTAVVLLFAVGLTVAAPVPKVAKKVDDATLLEGRWESVSFDSGAGPRADTSWWLEVKDGKLSTGCGKTNGYMARAFKLDPAASPKQLDIDDLSGKFILTAYQLDGDTLTWSESSSNTRRPPAVETTGGFNVFVFQRAKAK